MRVRILFFGGLKDLAGKSSDLLELPDGALVRDVCVCSMFRACGCLIGRVVDATLAESVNILASPCLENME